MMAKNERGRALLALLILAPAPTLGIAAVLVWWPGPVGRSLFAAAKIWLLLLPLLWRLFVDRRPLSWSKPRHGGLLPGLVAGLAMAAAVLGAFLVLAAGSLDSTLLRTEAGEMGIASPMKYLLGAAYWIFVNSVVEEYVYRWFVLEKLRVFLRPWPAIIGSALVFTAHHVVAVATYLPPFFTALASTGVFVGGIVWAWMVIRFRSIWPGWVAHAVADVAVFACGWALLFM